MTDDVTVTLPTWLPLANFALSLVALVAYLYLFVRAIKRGKMHGATVRLISLLVGAAVVVLVGGALNQLGVLSIEGWTIIGTGGRIVVAAILVTLVTFDRGRPRN